MKRCVIFDLAEVLIAGLPRCEEELAPVFGISPDAVLPGLRGEVMLAYNRGEMSEDEYWARTCARNGWRGDVERAKAVLRRNFARKVPGTEDVLRELAPLHRVFLLSDHNREWIDHIEGIHPFLGMFERRFYSYDLGCVKTERRAFEQVLAAIGAPAAECVFIDDFPQNVATARAVGIDGIVFTGAEALRAALAGRGLL
ncbi:MAG TPA: HAD-IA family hydrolase [Planctomycetota bacterium]|nr:HAD-IA family hydrolase [Planctomycetota bacterium]